MLHPTTPRLIHLFLILCASIGTSQAQDSLRLIWNNQKNPDSIRFKAINQYYVDNTFAKPDSSLLLTQYHFDLAEKNNAEKEMAKALNERGIAFFIKGEIDSSVAMLKDALHIVSRLNDSLALARQYVNLGTICREQDKYQEAVRYYLQGLKIFKETNTPQVQGDILNNLGLVYYDIDNFDIALDYLNQALEAYKKDGIENEIGNIWLNIGGVHFQKGDYTKTTQYLQKAIKILKASDHLLSVADCYLLFAKTSQKVGKTEEALEFANQSLKISRQLENEIRSIETLTFIAELTFISDVDEATRMGEDILIMAKDKTDKPIIANLYNLLYKCYKAQNKYSSSLKMHEKYVTYADSIQVEKNNIAIVREAIQDEFEIKLLQNKLDNEKAQAQLKLNQLKRIYTIISVSVLLIAFILFFARSTVRANRKKRQLLLEELERLKAPNNSSIIIESNKFELNRNKIEQAIDRKINETDWTVLSILLDNPVIPNKEIAEKAFLSVDGIGSSLRRMYDYFDIKESKYKKISLLMEAIKISNKTE